VLFRVRPEARWLNSDVSRAALIFRYDMPRCAYDGGCPEAYAQLLVAPYFTPKFAFVVGSGLGMPTATGELLGTVSW
jgi:hypothetical protein